MKNIIYYVVLYIEVGNPLTLNLLHKVIYKGRFNFEIRRDHRKKIYEHRVYESVDDGRLS